MDFRKIVILLLLLPCFSFGAKRDLRVELKPVASGFFNITDIVTLPDEPDTILILQKDGKLLWHNLKTKKGGVVRQLEVQTRSELGLLGIALHPNFKKNKKLYLNYNPSGRKKPFTRISEWRFKRGPKKKFNIVSEMILMEFAQPYPNHNGGQLAFGPDGYLYIGTGDGGSAGDPHKHGQNPSTILGKILRINVDKVGNTKAYTVPADNPFVKKQNYLPEIWAVGIRNPWRFSFSPRGQLIVADVGQNAFEEVSIVKKGANLGWNHMEASHCYQPEKNCKMGKRLTLPFIEYPHQVGQSITGGYVYKGSKVPALKNKYIFGDYVSGRLFASNLPTKKAPKPKLLNLGTFGIMISTFGVGPDGELLIADFARGSIYHMSPTKK